MSDNQPNESARDSVHKLFPYPRATEVAHERYMRTMRDWHPRPHHRWMKEAVDLSYIQGLAYAWGRQDDGIPFPTRDEKAAEDFAATYALQRMHALRSQAQRMLPLLDAYQLWIVGEFPPPAETPRVGH